MLHGLTRHELLRISVAGFDQHLTRLRSFIRVSMTLCTSNVLATSKLADLLSFRSLADELMSAYTTTPVRVHRTTDRVSTY